jgi:hypothetical protein
MKYRQDLKKLTLLTVTSVDIEAAAKALIVSSEFCDFGAIKLLSPIKPIGLPNIIQHISIPSIDFLGYSKFMIEELHKYVDTQFCLVVQADGFLINPQSWNTQFLEYDYIGAPWPPFVGLSNSAQKTFTFDKNRVGNGGFSLRSKKLLEFCSRIKFDDLDLPIKSEDLIICHFLYKELSAQGIKFAPLDLASTFSTELIFDGLTQGLSKSFGFHGKHWLSNDYLTDLASSSAYFKEFSDLLTKPSIFSKNQPPNRIGRLDPCPCGSAKRFKDCHGKVI